jgi:HD-GYP domain-containing protein (c-di-GMP phosphodiesterase class II)
VLWVAALRAFGGLDRYLALGVLSVLAVVAWRVGTSTIESRVQIAVGHIAVLAAAAMLHPAGAGLVGLSMTLAARGPIPLRARVFNVGMWTLVSTVSAVVFQTVGGTADIAGVTEAAPLLLHVGIPLVVADIAQTVLNAVLLAGVIKVAVGVPIRLQMARLLTNTGLTSIGYGVLAFVLVVLWLPAGLGPASVILILAPMLGAWWAYHQYGEERAARERTLDVLVAAIETKAPHLAGHSARVAELCGAMAEHLGMRAHEVRDTRTAGMLHDVGQVALPTAVVTARGADGDGTVFGTYPARGAHILREVSFLAGALDGIAHHRDGTVWPETTTAKPGKVIGTSARVVAVADRFDLLTRVAADEGVLSPPEALARLRRDADQEDLRIVDALVAALARHPDEAAR